VEKNNGHMAQCVLAADGFRAVFDCGKTDASGDYFDVVIEWSLAPEFGGVNVKSVPTFISRKELRKLASYLGEHIGALRSDPAWEAVSFVPQELGFQLQALPGEVDQDDEGEFSVRFMVNVGSTAQNDSRVFVGGETTIDVRSVKAFIAAVDAVLAAPIRTP
jgi:hypothetical protein